VATVTGLSQTRDPKQLGGVCENLILEMVLSRSVVEERLLLLTTVDAKNKLSDLVEGKTLWSL